MIPEPHQQANTPEDRTPANGYNKRWRWWYSSIADWMIRNPGGKLGDCARDLRRNQATISQIIHTDMFKEYYSQRKAEWSRDHDYAIRSKLTAVAEKSLDIVLDNLTKKGNQIPMQRLESLATSTLDRLGYGPQASPSVVVNNNSDHSSKTVVIPGLTPEALEEARAALRASEQQKSGQSLLVASPSPSVKDALEERGAAHDVESLFSEEEVVDASRSD